MNNIAIIPARGGSKRIPRKNIKPFLGKPIIAYSIEAAFKSDLFEEIMVSTDDEEIADLARQLGANVPFMRSARNADDFTTTVDVLLEVIQAYEKRGKSYEYGCCIYPTAPFVSADLLKKAYEKLVVQELDTVFPVLQYSFPIQRSLRINAEQKVEMWQPEHLTTRSQDLEPAYHDAGQFYWFQIAVLNKKKQLLTENTGGILLSEMDAHDIDNMEDWKVAAFKYQMNLNDYKA